MDELVRGVFTPEAITCHGRVIERMKEAGCDAVVLGCTEIPLIISDANFATAHARFHAPCCTGGAPPRGADGAVERGLASLADQAASTSLTS
ncbi:MAG TPA: hypothetical protein VLX85_06965 [Stellaceae bacterium]|nr:hypothetical protein [Stellaceae bacterium]